MRRNKAYFSPQVFIFLTVAGLFIVIIKLLFFSYSNSAATTVEKFYSFEQKNNYSDSWELFHPYMKEKFPKPTFIQDRSHVFIGHFGAESFDCKISEGEKIKNWRPAKEAPLQNSL